MRLLFLSDTHLGFDLPRRPPRPGHAAARPRRGADFFETLEVALAPARRGEVDAVLHGGDLLYRSRVPAWLADAALAPLRRLAEGGLPVLLVPGNHERGAMPYPLLARHPRLHLFDRPRTVLLEAGGLRAAFSGFPYAHEVRARFPALLEEARRGAPEADLRLLVMHQCVEGATCGPGCFTFRAAPDVVRRDELPRDVAAVLCGHIHRHQILPGEGPMVIYAGATERTSAAEAGEEKVALIVELDRGGLAGVRTIPMPARAVPERRRWKGREGSRATATAASNAASNATATAIPTAVPSPTLFPM